MLHNHVAQRVALHSMLQDCLGFGRFKTHSTKCWGSLHLDCVCVSVNRHSIQVLWLVDAVHEGYLALSVIGQRWPNSVTGSSVQTGIQQNMCWMCTEVYTFVQLALSLFTIQVYRVVRSSVSRKNHNTVAKNTLKVYNVANSIYISYNVAINKINSVTLHILHVFCATF